MVPAGYLRPPKQITKSITGGRVDATVLPDPSNDTISNVNGELLAVENDILHIPTAATGLQIRNNKAN